MKIAFKIVLFAVWLSVFAGCKQTHTNESENKPYCLSDSLLMKCTIDTVKSEGVMNELNLSGKVAFNEDKVVKVVALASGHAQEVKAMLGDYVKEGQILAIVKSSDLAGFHNEYVAAKSNLALAQKNLDAARDFYKGGLNSEKDLLSAEKEFQKAQSEFNRMSEVMKIYGNGNNPDESTSAMYYIKSPINGFIVEKNINSGMEIRPDEAESLFTISDLKDVWVIANLYETDINKVQPDYKVVVSTLGYGDKQFAGKIDRISSVINPETKALNFRVFLQNTDYLLKPGMFARITVHYPDNNKMLAIPKNSVVFDDNKNYVVKFKDKCNMQMQLVKVAKTVGDRTYVSTGDAQNGLNEGDKIITRNALFIFTALKKL